MKISRSFKRVDNQDSKSKLEWPQILTVLAATLSAFTGGQLYTWTSVGIPKILSDDFPANVTFEEVSYLANVPSMAAILFSVLFSYLADIVGRKPFVVFINVPYLISFIMIAFSRSLVVLYIARFVGGIGDAIIYTVLPSYVGEVTTPKIRGTWGNALTFQIVFGQFLINIYGSYLDITTSSLISAVIPVFGLVITLFLPETPYFLLMKKRDEQAKISLQKLRRIKNVDEELVQLTEDVNRQVSERGNLKDLVIGTNRKSLLVAIALRFAQQFSGITVFIAYTQYIFQLAKGDLSSVTSAILISGLFVVTSLFASVTLDMFGRRLALIISCAGSAASLTIECIYFYCSDYTQLSVVDYGWVPITGLLGYVAFYSIGLGVAPTLMLGELFSANVKGKALSVVLIFLCIFIIGSTAIFQVLLVRYGLLAPFVLYAACAYVMTIFSYYCIPETKGKTLEEIQQSLKSNQ